MSFHHLSPLGNAHMRLSTLLFFFGTMLLVLFAQAAASFAAQVHESDLSVSSQVGKVNTQAEGRDAEARSAVHSVNIHPEARTGDVNVSGKADKVLTQAGGQNTNAASAIGGVNVGGK